MYPSVEIYLIKINGQKKPIEVTIEDARNIITQINDGMEFIGIKSGFYRASEIMSISRVTYRKEIKKLIKAELIPPTLDPDFGIKPSKADELELCEFYGNYCLELNELS